MIAVIDDDPSVRRALKRLLRSFRYDVEVFASAGEFLDSGNQECVDCLILDIHMDQINGFELQKQLQESGRNFPVIFITAHDDELTREQASSSKAIAYLRKPFDDESLLQAIEKALAVKQSPH
jgi:FixJ family two-component response regulator